MRVLGADAAEIGGRLAALAMLKDFQLQISEEELQRLRAEQAHMERFRQGLAQAFPWPAEQAAQLPDDALVCRCEAITAGELRRRGLSVILLEHGLVGQQASGTNFGNVRRQGCFLVQLPLANRSRTLWGWLKELIGDDIEFMPSGHIRVCYRREPVPYAIEPTVGVSTPHPEEIVYFRQITRGNIVIGGCGHGPAYPDLRRAYVLPEHTIKQFTQLARVAPALSRLSIIRVWSGIEGYMADDLPMMGPSSQVGGLYYAFAFSGHGFQLGPGVGEMMAELIHTGETPTPIAPFRIDRFFVAREALP